MERAADEPNDAELGLRRRRGHGLMRVLVTGGAGFIGRWVVAQLLETSARVVVVDNYSSGCAANLAEFARHPGLEVVIEGDLKEPELVERVFAVDYDVVFHLAASTRVQAAIDAPRASFDNDVVGTLHVLEAMRRQFFRLNGHPGVGPFHPDTRRAMSVDRRPRLVFASSANVYDRAHEGPIREDHALRPASPLAACKLAAESLALSYGRTYGLPVRVARVFNTYGPYQRPSQEGGAVAHFLAQAMAGRPLEVKGTGTQTRDLLYVEDCARLLIALGDDAAVLDGEVVNAATGLEVSVRDLALRIADAGVPVVAVPHDHPQAEVMRLVGDPGRAAALLGFRPQVDLDEGLSRTLAFLAAQPRPEAPIP